MSGQTEQAVAPLARTSEGKAAEVESLIAAALDDMGFEIVRVQMMGGSRRPTLQIMVERPDGSLTVDDCAEVSRTVSAILDVEDPIAEAYHLEVSSPGVDRPLTRLKDFVRFAGLVAKVELAVPQDGRKRFTGRLVGVDDEAVLLAMEGSEAPLRLSFREMAKAKLVLNDELIAVSAGAENEN
jgi:ribosome maturation factor RimP